MGTYCKELYHFERKWGAPYEQFLRHSSLHGSSNVWIYLNHLKNSSWSGELPRCKWLTCRSRWWLNNNNDFPLAMAGATLKGCETGKNRVKEKVAATAQKMGCYQTRWAKLIQLILGQGSLFPPAFHWVLVIHHARCCQKSSTFFATNALVTTSPGQTSCLELGVFAL